jgi:hypothetical protein
MSDVVTHHNWESDHLIEIPMNGRELMLPDIAPSLHHIPNPQIIIDAGFFGGAVSAALAALGEANAIIPDRVAQCVEHEMEAGLLGDESISAERLDRFSRALERRSHARQLLVQAEAHYQDVYMTDQGTTPTGRPISAIDTEKLSDLYDATDQYEGLEPIKLIKRVNTGSSLLAEHVLTEDVRAHAERLLLILLADDIELEEETTPDSIESSGPTDQGPNPQASNNAA